MKLVCNAWLMIDDGWTSVLALECWDVMNSCDEMDKLDL